jgi:hypothetical protein
VRQDIFDLDRGEGPLDGGETLAAHLPSFRAFIHLFPPAISWILQPPFQVEKKRCPETELIERGTGEKGDFSNRKIPCGKVLFFTIVHPAEEGLRSWTHFRKPIPRLENDRTPPLKAKEGASPE